MLVFGSGNLGLVYASGEDHRLNRAEIEARWPGLLPGLAGHVVIQASHTGLVFSEQAAALAADFLETGHFQP